jgi:hypothetical protein
MHEKHTIKTACTNVLPDDENKVFETCVGSKMDPLKTLTL